jgi:UPF0271 protein
MGEGMLNDASLMPFISSANIACGYHAGNEDIIKRTIELALKNNVAIGAHPSYNDRENFGRLSQSIALVELAELISDQISLFEKITNQMGCKIHHVKLHGALYNDCAKDALLSKIVAQTIQAIDPSIMLYGLSGSHTIKEARAIGLRSVQEVFAVNAETVCIHGDHEAAVEIAKNLFNTLQQYKIEIKQP